MCTVKHKHDSRLLPDHHRKFCMEISTGNFVWRPPQEILYGDQHRKFCMETTTENFVRRPPQKILYGDHHRKFCMEISTGNFVWRPPQKILYGDHHRKDEHCGKVLVAGGSLGKMDRREGGGGGYCSRDLVAGGSRDSGYASNPHQGLRKEVQGRVGGATSTHRDPTSAYKTLNFSPKVT